MKPTKTNWEATKSTVEYRTWKHMRERCGNARHPQFSHYGGRGIGVCGRWDDYLMFLADMGRRPSPQHSIDRTDNNGNYEPSNCRWATRAEQLSNTRRTILLSAYGQIMPLKHWALRLRIAHATLRKDILNYGRTLDEAIVYRTHGAWGKRLRPKRIAEG